VVRAESIIRIRITSTSASKVRFFNIFSMALFQIRIQSTAQYQGTLPHANLTITEKPRKLKTFYILKV
jgi:hypothetical protein